MTMIAGNAAETLHVGRLRPSPISARRLAEISHRLNSPLNDDGLRAAYPTDVADLFAGVLDLQQTVGAVVAQLSGPPLDNVAPGTGPAELARLLKEEWVQVETKLYRDRKLAEQRARAQDLGKRLGEATKRVEELQGEVQRAVDQFALEHLETDRLRSILRETQTGRAQQEQRATEAEQRIKALEAEVQELARIRDEGEAIRQSQAAMLTRHADRIEAMRRKTIELTGVIGSA